MNKQERVYFRWDKSYEIENSDIRGITQHILHEDIQKSNG